MIQINSVTKKLVKPFSKSLKNYLGRNHPELLAKILYKWILGRKLELKHPKDLNEKINWLKFYSDTSEWTRLADKYRVRDYVKERGLEHILLPLYGKWDKAEDIDFDSLPQQFVLKSNNGAGTVMIVRNKSELNIPQTQQTLNKWLLQTKIGCETAEPHYTKIKPCLIAEQLLEDNSIQDFSISMIDYKIWCFNGKPYYCLVVYNRNIESNTILLNTYDLEWAPMKNSMTKPETRFKHLIDKPKNWDKMLEYATILAKGHLQVRVDLYSVNNKIYFGEMTFTSEGGYMTYYTPEMLRTMGDLIQLPSSVK